MFKILTKKKMKNISLILAISSFSSSPFFVIDGHSTFNIQNSYFSKHFKSMLISNFQYYKNFNIKNTKFNKILNTAIKLDSYDANNKHFINHQIFISPSVSISQCSFSNCIANDPYSSFSGGALYVQFDFNKKNVITISQSTFTNCSAKSSSGAFYIASSKVNLADTCIHKCSAQVNQAFYMYGKHHIITGNTIIYNGYFSESKSFKYKKKQEINCHFAYSGLSCVYCNFSHNGAQKSSLFQTSDTKSFIFNKCFFGNSLSEDTEINIRESENCVISQSIFVDNVVLGMNRISLTNPLLFANCSFSFIPYSNDANNAKKVNYISLEKEQKFISFSQCIFSINENDFESFAQKINLKANCKFDFEIEIPDDFIIQQKECFQIDRLNVLQHPNDMREFTRWIPKASFITNIFCFLFLLSLIFYTSIAEKEQQPPAEIGTSLFQ